MKYLITTDRAHTLIEMMLCIIIFSLMLGTIFTVLSVGLKSWQMGEITTDSQHAAEVAIQRITGDLKITNRATCKFDKVNSADPDYICFENPLNEHEFKTDSTTREPIWQSHIIYYTLTDPNNPVKKILYRRVVSHTPSVIPVIPNNMTISSYLTSSEVAGERPRVVARDVETFQISQGEGDLIKIKLVCAKTMRERKMAYEQDFNRDVKASITVSTSIRPRN